MFDWMPLIVDVVKTAPTIMAIFAAALAGERTAHKFLKAACQVVFILAEKQMDNSEKRQTAITMLYKKFPVFGRVAPNWLLGKLVDIAWEQVIKPVAKNSR